MLEFKLSFDEQQEALDPLKLSEFIFHFKILIAAISNIDELNKTDEVQIIDEKLLELIRTKLKNTTLESIEKFSASKVDDELRITSISYNSPLEIAFICWGSIITLAVVFGGGTIDSSINTTGVSLKAKIPSLGEGIEKIRQAFMFDKNIKTGFGVKSTIIKLNKNEYELLMMIDEKTKNRGGFQRFLVSLKYRIKRSTRKLELSPSDIEKIYRYKQDPKKGGFQGRCKKIFERHFPER